MDSRILIIDPGNDRRWVEVTRNAADKLGRGLEVVSGPESDSIALRRDYALVVLDASFVSDSPRTVAAICSRNPSVHLMVFSPAPQWQEAKEVILAGAADYELKSSREEHILLILKRNLDKLVSRHTSVS